MSFHSKITILTQTCTLADCMYKDFYPLTDQKLNQQKVSDKLTTTLTEQKVYKYLVLKTEVKSTLKNCLVPKQSQQSNWSVFTYTV